MEQKCAEIEAGLSEIAQKVVAEVLELHGNTGEKWRKFTSCELCTPFLCDITV
jgi:hypothetical protein